MARSRSINCSGQDRCSAMPTIAARSRACIFAAQARTPAAASPAHPATTPPARSWPIGAGVCDVIEPTLRMSDSVAASAVSRPMRALMFHFRKICGAALVVLGCSIPVMAQDAYPTRPIRLVVGFGAGGPTDIPARFIADKLGAALGHRVVVENKPAAAGMIATR